MQTKGLEFPSRRLLASGFNNVRGGSAAPPPPHPNDIQYTKDTAVCQTLTASNVMIKPRTIVATGSGKGKTVSKIGNMIAGNISPENAPRSKNSIK